MAKTEDREFNASPGRVFAACRQAVAQLGYTVIASDELGKMISFNTGRSMKSWAGQDLQATVVAGGTSSRIVVGGSIARRGGLAGAQQIAWGEKAALSKKFLDEVTTILPTIQEVAHDQAAAEFRTSEPNRLDELAKAADLKEKGFLTEEEFQAEKKRILGSQ